MRHERFEPRIYPNTQLMNELNDFCIALKVWLYPELFGDHLSKLQSNHPKPDLSEIDNLQQRINAELRKDSEPMIKY